MSDECEPLNHKTYSTSAALLTFFNGSLCNENAPLGIAYLNRYACNVDKECLG